MPPWSTGRVTLSENHHFLSILYDMSLVVGSETHAEPLALKTLQRLVFHTGFPQGVLLRIQDREKCIAELTACVGSSKLKALLGKQVKLGQSLGNKGHNIGEDEKVALMKAFSLLMESALVLPSGDELVFILFSSSYMDAGEQLLQAMGPVMSNFAKAYQLAVDNDMTLQRLESEIKRSKKAEYELSRQKSMLSTVLDNVVDGIISMDEDSIIRSFNPAAEQIFGYDREEVIGSSVTLLMDEGIRQEHDRMIQAFNQERDHSIFGVTRQLEGRRKNGELFPMSLAVGVQRQNNGVLFTGVVRDITEQLETRRQLEESEKLLKEAQKISRIGNWSHAIGYENSYWSDEMFRVIGLEPGTVETRRENYLARVHPEDLPRLLELEKTAIINPGQYVSMDHRLKGDEKKWVHLDAVTEADENGRSIRMTGTVQDITERKAVERELRFLTAKAEAASEAKSEFLSSMSHELRTPLNAILGFAQLLSRMNEIGEKPRIYLEEINNAGKHLLELINQVLELSRIESGDMNFSLEDVELMPLIGEVSSLVKPLADEKGVDLGLACLCHGDQQFSLLADRMRLTQVLVNLFNNAIKYNKPSGFVKFTCSETDDDFYRLEVHDNGAGIPAEKQAEVFQAFNRLGAENSGIEGSGIGLLICKQLTEAMGGRIGFESSVGKGSTFWIELKKVDTKRINPASTPEVELVKSDVNNRGQVLYIEDNPANVNLMQAAFEEYPDISLEIETTGEEGLEWLKHKRPDLVLLDIRLPGIDGYEVIKKIRRQQHLAGLPVIAVSANAMSKDIEAGVDSGFNHYLTKPVNLDELEALLDRYLVRA